MVATISSAVGAAAIGPPRVGDIRDDNDVPGSSRLATYTGPVIFKAVGDGAPYPTEATRDADWSEVPPRLVRLSDLITVKRT
jgi:hypothetical protein